MEAQMAHILTDREAIRQWVIARGGNPVLMDVPDGSKTRTVLQLSFGQDILNADANEGPDRIDGFQLVSWEEWFVALENGNLALLVSDDPSGGNEAEFSFVERE
jgi:hypothetical protein